MIGHEVEIFMYAVAILHVAKCTAGKFKMPSSQVKTPAVAALKHPLPTATSAPLWPASLCRRRKHHHHSAEKQRPNEEFCLPFLRHFETGLGVKYAQCNDSMTHVFVHSLFRFKTATAVSRQSIAVKNVTAN